MSLLKRMLGLKSGEPKKRVRVCIECGMPLDQHKDWCAILRTRQEMEQRRLRSSTETGS